MKTATPLSPYQYKAIEDHVLQMLEAETLQPGDRLPSLRKMAAAMKVSVPTVSQAYAELESRGVVEARERSGFYVRLDYGRMPEPTLCPTARPEAAERSRPGLIKAARAVLENADIDYFRKPFPDESLLSGRCLAKRLCAVMRDHPLEAARDVCDLGSMELRRILALRTMHCGVSVLPEDIIITTGALDGAAAALRAITRPGDAVLVQTPTYLVYLTMLEHMGLRTIEIPSCPKTGIPVDLVDEAIRNFDVKACLFIPNFHLDGSLTPDASKHRLVHLLAAHGIPLIEDDVYGDLHFGPERPRLCKSYDKEGNVISVSSFSKTLAPGYRVGWVLPGRYRDAFTALRIAGQAFASNPTQMAVADFLRRGEYERHIKNLRAHMADFMGKLHCKVRRHFPEGTQAVQPAGGTCMWIKLPESVDSKDLFFNARDQGIAVIPGALLATSGTFDNYIRLNASGVWCDGMDQAVARLGELVHELL